MPAERLEINRDYNARSDLDGSTPSQIIKFCETWIEKNGDHPVEILGDDVEINFVILRMETQEEADARVERDGRWRQAMLDNERREYERLKAKFEREYP